MSGQKQVKKVFNKDDGRVESKPVDKENAKKLKDEIDKLLDQIDEILETNSEEFVKSYVQKGGE